LNFIVVFRDGGVGRSGLPVELAFLHDPLVRFVHALDPVLALIALGRKQSRDLIDAAVAAAPIGPGRVADGLADLEFVVAQAVLRAADKAPLS